MYVFQLMEEFKQKHNKMFNSEDSSASQESSSVKPEVKRTLETITIRKSELQTIKIVPGAPSSNTRTISARNSTEASISQNHVPAQNGAPFNSKILSRSLSSAPNSSPKKKAPASVALTTVNESDSTDTGSIIQYWKKKTDSDKPGNPSNRIISKKSVDTTPFENSKSTPRLVSPSTSITTTSEQLITPPETTLSASELIKTFNSTATIKKSSNVSNVFLNKDRNVKSQAPPAPKQPVSVTSSVPVNPTPAVAVSAMVSNTNISRTSHLVKQQVSPQDLIIPPPPPMPSMLGHHTDDYSASDLVVSCHVPPTRPDEVRYSPVSISVNSKPVVPDPFLLSGCFKNDQNRTFHCSHPIPIATDFSNEISFENYSPSDLIIPRPPSPLLYISEIPKGVPPPPSSTVSPAVQTPS